MKLSAVDTAQGKGRSTIPNCLVFFNIVQGGGGSNPFAKNFVVGFVLFWRLFGNID